MSEWVSANYPPMMHRVDTSDGDYYMISEQMLCYTDSKLSQYKYTIGQYERDEPDEEPFWIDVDGCNIDMIAYREIPKYKE